MPSIFHFWPLRRRSPSGRSTTRPRLWEAGFLLLAAASVGGKIVSYGLGGGEQERADDRLVSFLVGHGWSSLGKHELMPGLDMATFAAPGCGRAVEAALVTPDGEFSAVMGEAAGPDYRLKFIERGRVRDKPSRAGYLRNRLHTVAAQVGIVGADRSILVAILEPVECRVIARVPWPAFEDS